MPSLSIVNQIDNSKETPFFTAVSLAIMLLLSGLVFLLAWHGLIYGAGSDPRYTLIVSQSILDNGTIALDAYANDEIWGEPANFAANFNIVERNGRFYNYFPAGPSLLSVPLVAIARLAGWDMRLAADNINAQRLLSALSLVALLWLMAGIARCFLPWRLGLVVTAVSLLGSTLISTMGTALWSINFSVLAIAAALLLLVRREMGLSHTIHPFWLGLLLFLAYFSRAAAAAFILPVLGLLAYRAAWHGEDTGHSGIEESSKSAQALIFSPQARELVVTAVTAAIFLALFLLWSKLEFGSWLPIYYSAARLSVARGPVWVALLGVLFSSGRGLFVYVPTAVLLLFSGRWLRRQPLASALPGLDWPAPNDFAARYRLVGGRRLWPAHSHRVDAGAFFAGIAGVAANSPGTNQPTTPICGRLPGFRADRHLAAQLPGVVQHQRGAVERCRQPPTAAAVHRAAGRFI